MSREARLERRAERERRARKEAERLLEQKSLELFEANQSLLDFNRRLEREVAARTEALEVALGQRDMLLQEVHHRVKNNLQIIASLLSMQAAQLNEEARFPLTDSIQRVRAMALVHEHLYAGETVETINLAAYLTSFVGAMRMVLAQSDEVSVEAEQVMIEVEQAIPLGLIVNELLSNAAKYGRSEDGTCRVSMTLRTTETEIVLEVADAGPGLPAPWNELPRRSLGVRIITSLARQLRASIETPSGAGFRFVLRLASQ